MIAQKTVGVTSTEISDGGRDITITADISNTVWLAVGVPAEVGKGVRLDLYAPKHTFYGHNTSAINAIAVSAGALLGIHEG